jgi:hypothetical protein
MITLATTNGRPPHTPFVISLRDRFFHMFAVGQTGTGKSSLMASMARQDAAQGIGFCLIDPHGDLAEEVVGLAGEGVLYWNVADPSCGFGFNPLAPVDAEHRPLVASHLIETLKKQWEDAWGARMEHLLRYSLLALLERDSSTLHDIMPIFLDKEFRSEVVAGVSDPQVHAFWEQEYPAMNYRTAVDGVAPIANKLGAFLAHPVVRKALCTPETPLRFRELMDSGKVLVVNLGKGRLGADTANVVGGLIVSAIAHAAYTREDITEASRRPFFLYVDEFHSFTTGAFADMLSELRKYGLGLVATTQYLMRLTDSVREALFGNVGTLLAFRVGATDAAILEKQFGSDVPRARDLVGLANYELFIKLMVEGVQTKAFSARTLAPESA